MRDPLGAAGPARRAEAIDRIHHCRRDEPLSLRGLHRQFFVPVDDGAGLEQGCRDARILEHDQLIVAIDACFGIQQLALERLSSLLTRRG